LAFHREVHEGPYGGTHYLVDLELPPMEVVAANLRKVNWSFATGRGISVYDLECDVYEYLSAGSRTFRVELILTSLSDLVESDSTRASQARSRAARPGNTRRIASTPRGSSVHAASRSHRR
jgi:hypothetical protein